jgi:hypothetical protein
LALQWASLDVLSKGHTILAVCSGGSALDGPQFAHELEVMGVPSRERVGRVVEGMNVLRRLWSEERVSHHGTYYRFTDVDLLPKPVQQPIPILIVVNPKEERVDAATTDRILRRVACRSRLWRRSIHRVASIPMRLGSSCRRDGLSEGNAERREQHAELKTNVPYAEDPRGRLASPWSRVGLKPRPRSASVEPCRRQWLDAASLLRTALKERLCNLS